jgi:phosphohistidine swiveling domain-containing protein
MKKDWSKLTVEELENEMQEILDLLPENQHSDLFRAVVFLGQLEVAKFIYHDKKHNPMTRYRKSKTKQGETIAFSQALVQLLLLMKVRGIDFAQTFEHAIEHMKDMDFTERKPQNNDEIKGMPISGGKVIGKAYVVPHDEHFSEVPEDSIVVLEHAEPGVAELLLKARAVVTDQGGKLCHMAVLARENAFPAVIGTGNATSKIRTGDLLSVDADTGEVVISKN